jgi:acetolactate synthase I/II/III large subunit
MSAVADAIVRHLKNAGVAAIFGMPGGGSNLDIVEAAGHAGLPFVLTATETGAAIAAIAQAEITGKPGACITTLGPGVASIVNGVACASLERAPLIVMTDAAPAPGTFEHQRIDHRALLAPVTKFSTAVTASNVEDVMPEALARATANPAGPVHLELSAT